jgi:hypothetical protein
LPPDPVDRVEPYVPAVIQPDPARDARRAAYRAKERARVSRAFDSYMTDLYGDLFEERYGVRPRPAADEGEGDS